MKHLVVHFPRSCFLMVFAQSGLHRVPFKHSAESNGMNCLTIGPIGDVDLRKFSETYKNYRLVVVD